MTTKITVMDGNLTTTREKVTAWAETLEREDFIDMLAYMVEGIYTLDEFKSEL